MTLDGFPKAPNVFHLRPSSGGSLIKETIMQSVEWTGILIPPKQEQKNVTYLPSAEQMPLWELCRQPFDPSQSAI